MNYITEHDAASHHWEMRRKFLMPWAKPVAFRQQLSEQHSSQSPSKGMQNELGCAWGTLHACNAWRMVAF